MENRKLRIWLVVLILIVLDLFIIDHLSSQELYEKSEADQKCEERGHIIDYATQESTLTYSPPYYLDYGDSTVIVYPNYNRVTYICLRCGRVIVTSGEEKRVKIWQREFEIIVPDMDTILTEDTTKHIKQK